MKNFEMLYFIWVEGEVSDLRQPQSWHVYFTLKGNKNEVIASG